MELRQMRVFRAVVELGSFRRASEELNLSQPSVSQYIASLEEECGVELFRRGGRGVSVTPHGLALYSLTKDVLTAAELIPKHFSELEQLQRGSLMIGTTHHIADVLLPGCVKEFRRSHPQINISILTGNAGAISSQILDGRIDLGIIGRVLTKGTENADLQRIKLGFEHLRLAVPKGHPLEGRSVSPQEVMRADIPLARYMTDHPLGFLVDDYLLRRKMELRHDLVFNSVYLAAKFTAEGNCLSIISESVADDCCRSGKIGTAELQGLDEVLWETELIFHRTRGISFAGWEMIKVIQAEQRRRS